MPVQEITAPLVQPMQTLPVQPPASFGPPVIAAPPQSASFSSGPTAFGSVFPPQPFGHAFAPTLGTSSKFGHSPFCSCSECVVPHASNAFQNGARVAPHGNFCLCAECTPYNAPIANRGPAPLTTPLAGPPPAQNANMLPQAPHRPAWGGFDQWNRSMQAAMPPTSPFDDPLATKVVHYNAVDMLPMHMTRAPALRGSIAGFVDPKFPGTVRFNISDLMNRAQNVGFTNTSNGAPFGHSVPPPMGFPQNPRPFGGSFPP